MNNPESIKIIERFYQALDQVIANKLIRGKKTFCDRHGIDRWNLNTVRKKPESDMFQMSWISDLCNDFGISVEWIMTGRGGMFVEKDQKSK
jgi:aromatic ring-cleaving dioxygenase